MEICLYVEGEEGVAWEQWLALARACEEAGLAGLFVSDHYASVEGRSERGSLDVWAVLAGLAAHTRRIRLGTLVSPVTYRHPSILAKTAATVDHISRGRVELGLGAGWYEREHLAYGFAFPGLREREGRLAEALQIVHEQWTEDMVSFHGEHWSLERCAALFKPLQQPHPPIIVGGGGGPGSVEPAARWADEYNVAGEPPGRYRHLRQQLDQACARHGRDPRTVRLSYMNATLLGASEADLERRARRVAEARGERRELLGEIRASWAAGTPEQVVAHLEELWSAGVQRVYLHHVLHDDLDMVALVGRTVVPALS